MGEREKEQMRETTASQSSVSKPQIHSPGDGNHAPPGVFEKMDAVKERVTDLDSQTSHWNTASPNDVYWLCSRILRVLATIQDARVTYGYIGGEDEPGTPMMVERDAIVEALYADL